MRQARLAAAFAVLLTMPSLAAAHLALQSPPSRYGDTVLKLAPCGKTGGARSSHVTELDGGAPLEVVWDEYVNHPGHFRISFDDDGDDDFADPPCLGGCDTRAPTFGFYSNPTVLLDDIADTPQGGIGRATITLPDIDCDNCTLQVIQVMYDKPPQTSPGDDIYYQCADLVLHRSAAATASVTSTPSTTPTSTRRPPPSATATRPAISPTALPTCVGDCTVPGTVTLGDIVGGVEIALDLLNAPACAVAFDANFDQQVTVDELIASVRGLGGCEP